MKTPIVVASNFPEDIVNAFDATFHFAVKRYGIDDHPPSRYCYDMIFASVSGLGFELFGDDSDEVLTLALPSLVGNYSERAGILNTLSVLELEGLVVFDLPVMID